MPAPYSMDLRRRVVDAHQAKLGSLRQLADRFQVSLSFVQRLMRTHKNIGEVKAKAHGGGAIAKIKIENLPAVQQLVNEQPDAILS